MTGTKRNREQLNKMIDELQPDSQGNYLLLHKSKRLYRVKANENSALFSPEKMWEAPVDKTRQNRYNLSGIPVLKQMLLLDINFRDL